MKFGDAPDFEPAVRSFLNGRSRVALTGAGISVGCGIPDFRSSEGLWERFDPDEYATLDAFRANPAKAWSFYRALGAAIEGREEGPAHRSLAHLEQAGLLDWVITQNVDSLHRKAGSRNLLEVHGDAGRLQCLTCDRVEFASSDLLRRERLPLCVRCGQPLKPDVVLFGEDVRGGREIEEILAACDVMLLIGTSGQVFPVSEYPRRVAAAGGVLIEFNIEKTRLSPFCRFRFEGRVDRLLPAFVDQVLREATGG